MTCVTGLSIRDPHLILPLKRGCVRCPGADVAIVYLPKEQKDADQTKRLVEEAGRKALLLPKDLKGGEKVCKEIIDKVTQLHAGAEPCNVHLTKQTCAQHPLKRRSDPQLHSTPADRCRCSPAH